MAEIDVVELLQEYLADGGRTLEARAGPEVVANVEEMAALVQVELQEDESYGALWDAFARDPQGTAAELTGALEALVEADASFAMRLNAYMEEHRRLTAEPSARVAADRDRSYADVGATPDVTRNVPVPRSDEEPEDLDQEHEGTYLYGNEEAGAAELGEGIGHGEGEPQAEGWDVHDLTEREAAPASLHTETFEALYALIESHPELDEDTKVDLQARLQEIQQELVHLRARAEGRTLSSGAGR